MNAPIKIANSRMINGPSSQNAFQLVSSLCASKEPPLAETAQNLLNKSASPSSAIIFNSKSPEIVGLNEQEISTILPGESIINEIFFPLHDRFVLPIPCDVTSIEYVYSLLVFNGGEGVIDSDDTMYVILNGVVINTFLESLLSSKFES